MRNSQEFDTAYQELEAQLSSMTAEEFFGGFGLSIEDLPDKKQYSSEKRITKSETVFYGNNYMDLKCA